MSEHKSNGTGASIAAPELNPMGSIYENVRACMQCGSCTGSCASSDAMDIAPRELWRMVQLGLKDDIFKSRTFWLCSSCYYCTLRCPRGLPLTETMAALKRMAVAEGLLADKKSPVFYRTFMDTVRRYGRVREMELMTRYFIALGNPAVPVGFTPLGVKLFIKGKISLQMPSLFSEGKLDPIYRKVREMEASS